MFVLINRKTGKYIDIDDRGSYSSGYPYDVDSIWRARQWDNAEDAIRLTAVMSYKDYNNPVYDLAVVEAAHVVINMPTGKTLEDIRYRR